MAIILASIVFVIALYVDKVLDFFIPIQGEQALGLIFLLCLLRFAIALLWPVWLTPGIIVLMGLSFFGLPLED